MAEPTLLDQYAEPAAYGEIERAPEGYEPAPSQPTLLEVYGEGYEAPLFPTTEEKVTEAAIGTAQGVTRGTASTGAALYGGQKAAEALKPMLATPYTARLYPFAVGTAALGSAILGNEAVKPLEDALFPAKPREELVPYREGGITFGETIAAAPFAFGLPKSDANMVARMLSNMGETARKNKKAWLAAETGVGLTAGTAGGVSVAYAPDSPGTRFAAEVTAGMLHPLRVFTEGLPKLKESLTALKGSFSADARQQRAADRLVKLLDETGEDVPTLIKALREQTPEVGTGNITPTAAQKTGSEALTMLETTLAKENAKYSAEIQQQGDSAIQAYRALIGQLTEIGNPQLLRLAAEYRRDMFNGLLQRRLELAQRNSAEAISKIKVDTASSRREVGQIVQKNVEDALSEAREHEATLWRRAEKSRQVRGAFRARSTGQAPEVEAPNLAEEFLEIASTITPERLNALPKQVRDVIKRLGVTDEHIELYKMGKESPAYMSSGIVPFEYRPGELTPTTAGDLVAIRSDFLELARKANVEGNAREANFFSRLAQKTYDDIDTQLVGPEYDEARAFSRSLNDVFTRSYANDITAMTRKGEQIPPEILVQRAFGSNNDVAALRMEQIEDAVGMMADEYDTIVKRFGADSPQAQAMVEAAEASRQRITSIQDAHNRVLRVAANKLMKTDPATGDIAIDPARLQTFVNENEKMLRHVGLYDDMTDVVRAETALRNVIKKDGAIAKKVNEQSAFAKLLGYESATEAVASVLNSKNPVKSFERIVKLATREPGNMTLNGLKSTVYDYAFIKAGGANRFSPQAFDSAMFDPIAPGLPSIYQIMQVNGAMTYKEGQNLRKLLVPMERVERAMGNKQMLEEILAGGDAVSELALRVIGAKAGTTMAGGQGGSSLIAAAAGSKYMRQMFDKAPTMLTRGIIQEATKDPKLMAMLLERGKPKNAPGFKINEKERLQRLSEYLIGMGFRPPSQAAMLNVIHREEAEEEMPMTPEAPIRRPQASRMLQEMPTAQTRGLPQAGGQQAAAPAQAPQPTAQGPEQGSSREMLQRLFPMDTMLS